MLSAFVAMSLLALSADFNFYHYLFGGGLRGLRLSGSEFRVGRPIAAQDFDISAGGCRILVGFRRFRRSRGLQCLRLATEIPL